MSIGYTKKGVIHGPIKEEVISQLEARRKLLFKKDRNTKQLEYLNSKTGWIQVSSGINVIEPGSKSKTGTPSLARKNVLAGGTISNGAIKGGILGNNPSYSATEQYGLRPMAGITDFQVDVVGTYGSLRRATVNFRANSKEQLDTLETLYLRPGFSIFMEWGHTHKLNSDLSVDTGVGKLPNFFDYTSDTKLYEEAEKLRIKSKHNYDYMFGRIHNFIWKYNTDTTYDCSISITGYGELVESLQAIINPKLAQDTLEEKDIQTSPIKDHTTALHSILNVILNSGAFSAELPGQGDQGPRSEEGQYATELGGLKQFKSTKKLIKKVLEELEKKGRLESNIYIPSIRSSTMVASAGSNSDIGVIKYIPIYFLLEIITQVFVLKDTKENTTVPIFNFYSGKNNIENITPFTTFKQHLCLDPLIGSLPKNGSATSIFSLSTDTKVYEYGLDFPFDGQVDDILNIYVSVEKVKQAFDKVVSNPNPNEQTVYKALNDIVDSLQDSLGGINSFDWHYVDEEKTWYLVDRTVTPSITDLTGSSFKLAGLGSFVKNINLTTKMSNDISSIIAIGAAANNSDIGTQVMGLQRYNSGLSDRLVTKRVLELTPKKATDENIENEVMSNVRLYKSYIKNFNDTYSNTSNAEYTVAYDPEEVLGIKSTHRYIMGAYLKEFTIKSTTSPPGLIPVELSFTLDGISGLKIGNAFTVEKGILPTRYDGEVGFIIKKLSHTLKNNQWETQVGALMNIISNETATLSTNIEVSLDEVFENSDNPYGKGKELQDHFKSLINK